MRAVGLSATSTSYPYAATVSPPTTADLAARTAAALTAQGVTEVSLGYDADYEQTAPGVGRQTNIIGNHVALVERGRCGPRCAIGDRQTVSDKESNMPSVAVKGPALRRRSSR